MRLRTGLILLAIGTAFPLAGFALLAAGFVVEHENGNLVAAAKARNRATMSAVDAELRGAISTLRALSVDSRLASGDLPAFHVVARAVLATQPSWVNLVLSEPGGRQLVNAAVPWGSPLPDVALAPRSLGLAVSTLQPAIDDLTAAPLVQNRLGIPVRVPVVREGKAVFVLTAVITAESFQRLIVDQNMPEGWVSGLVDTSGRLIARVPAKPAGALASTDYLAHVRDAQEGWYRGKTLEGADSYTAFLRSELTGWSIGYAVPVALVSSGAARAGWVMGLGMLMSIGAAALIGYWVSRGIARPMSQLADAAASLGARRQPAQVSSTIDEVVRLSRAIHDAWRTIDLRDDALRRSEGELRQQATELRQADINKSQFLALLSHELRNPLAPLRNGIALLRMKPDAPTLVATQAMMERQVTHLTRLIDDLLDVSRIDRGQLELRRERVALATVIANGVETARPAVDARHQALTVETDAMPLFVDGDPVRLSQVVSNLVHNAAKFTPAHGHITVRARAAGGEAVIAIEDDGAGFAMEDSQRIFDMFVQLGGRSSQAGGLGIGLTIVRSLVEMHGGRVEACSPGPGLGATVTVYLPLAGSPLVDALSPVRERAAAVGRRVLVVDDNADAAGSLAQILRLEGLDVREAYDGVQALQLADAFEPEVAFLDLNMPGMSGTELGGALRARPWAGSLRLVALTGMGQKADVEATRAAAFHAHLTKPASADDVLRLASEPLVSSGQFSAPLLSR